MQIFKDLQNVVCGPDIPLHIDKEKMLGRGGSAFVLRGEMMNPVSGGLYGLYINCSADINFISVTETAGCNKGDN